MMFGLFINKKIIKSKIIKIVRICKFIFKFIFSFQTVLFNINCCFNDVWTVYKFFKKNINNREFVNSYKFLNN